MLLINYLLVVVRARHRFCVIVLFKRVVALTHACRMLSCALSRVSVARVICTCRRTLFACVARRLRLIINSLPLINTHVNDVNASYHIF